jgi:hypothetical protein
MLFLFNIIKLVTPHACAREHGAASARCQHLPGRILSSLRAASLAYTESIL